MPISAGPAVLQSFKVRRLNAEYGEGLIHCTYNVDVRILGLAGDLKHAGQAEHFGARDDQNARPPGQLENWILPRQLANKVGG